MNIMSVHCVNSLFVNKILYIIVNNVIMNEQVTREYFFRLSAEQIMNTE